MSYYQIIRGVRYARDLITAAQRAMEGGRGEGRISVAEIEAIYRLAEDGHRITDVEKRTLMYISERYNLTDKARAWLSDKLAALTPPAGIDGLISPIVRGEYGLSGLQWRIDAATVRQQDLMGTPVLFQEALRGALDAFLYRSMGQLSLAGLAGRRALEQDESATSTSQLKAYMDRGILQLLPTDSDIPTGFFGGGTIPFESTDNWVFGLRIPDFEHLLFVAQVRRDGQGRFSYATFATLGDWDSLVRAIVYEYAGMPGLQWHIDAAEVAEQMKLAPGQNFGNALFAALNAGVFNGESSSSLRDLVQQEVWQDPDLGADHYIRSYVNAGTLYLIPIDYAAAGAAFPLPADFAPWTEGEWLFGLEMPAKTKARFTINVPRDSRDGDTAWINGLWAPDSRPTDEQLAEVIGSYGDQLEGLSLSFPEDAFQQQRTQFGPDWQTAATLLRQALSAIVSDYLTPQSVFYLVSQVHAEDIPASDFETPQAYRAAIGEQIRSYLGTGVLALLTGEDEELAPPQGEPLADNWVFHLQMPAFSDHAFWVVLPRWLDYEVRAYVYGVN